MDKEYIIKRTEEYVQQTLEEDKSGHDWAHIERVRNKALEIGEEEGADLFIVELGALLHDIADWKFHDVTEGPKVTREWLESLEVEEKYIAEVCHIVDNVSYKGANVECGMKTLEGYVVQDADRLDSIGAIGIERTFAYGATKGRPVYDPDIKPQMHDTFEKYKNAQSTSINHFYEKLLLIKDRLNTDAAKKIAQPRHEFMQAYLAQFLGEWEGSV